MKYELVQRKVIGKTLAAELAWRHAYCAFKYFRKVVGMDEARLLSDRLDRHVRAAQQFHRFFQPDFV